MSSAATVRTSTGKLTFRPVRSSMARTSRTAGTRWSLGTAYSISANRTRRSLPKMRSERSCTVLGVMLRAVSAESRGIQSGLTTAARWMTPNAWFSIRTSLTQLRQPARRACSDGASWVRVLVIVCAHGVCGHQKSSKWSLAAARSSKVSRTSSIRIGCCTERT